MGKVKNQKSKIKSQKSGETRDLRLETSSASPPSLKPQASSLKNSDAGLSSTPHSGPLAPGPRGFTLIEIMVVVFILGLLVTLVAPKVMGRTDEAKRTKAAADLRAVQQALNLYRLDNGGYPSTDQGLQALVTKPQSGAVPQRWNSEGYLEKVQTDPWGHPYVYLSNGDRYTLKSLGADGEEGGEGKYADLDSRDL